MKFQELIKIADVEHQEIKLRQWKLKRNENGKLWPTSPSSALSPTLSSGASSPDSLGSTASTPGSSPGVSRRQSVAEGSSPFSSNRNSSRLSGVFGSPRKSITFCESFQSF